jgi:hypothetical protein
MDYNFAKQGSFVILESSKVKEMAEKCVANLKADRAKKKQQAFNGYKLMLIGDWNASWRLWWKKGTPSDEDVLDYINKSKEFYFETSYNNEHLYLELETIANGLLIAASLAPEVYISTEHLRRIEGW